MIEAKIKITQRLNGVSDLKRYFDVLRSVNLSMGRNIYLLIDNDDGLKEFKSSLDKGKEVKKTSSGFVKLEFPNNVFLILFPDGYAAEELFKEYDSILESCANQIFNDGYTNAASDKNIPAHLTRAHASIRNKTINGLSQAKRLIRNSQDIKDFFWSQVEVKNLHIDNVLAKEIRSLIS